MRPQVRVQPLSSGLPLPQVCPFHRSFSQLPRSWFCESSLCRPALSCSVTGLPSHTLEFVVLHHAELHLLARVVGHTSPSSRTWEAIAKRSGAQDQSELHHNVNASLSYGDPVSTEKKKSTGQSSLQLNRNASSQVRPIADIVSERLASRTLDHPLEEKQFLP